MHYPILRDDQAAHAGGPLDLLQTAPAVHTVPGNGHRPLLPSLAQVGLSLGVSPLLPAGHLARGVYYQIQTEGKYF